MTSPLISIIIPCYNHVEYVQDCIQSVIDQTYANLELIIIDDGSKDQSVEKIQEMQEKCKKRFLRFEFRHRINKGLSATLNEALEWCQGEYFSIIASDDMMLKEKTEIQVKYLLSCNNKVIGVFGGYHLIDNHNHVIKTVIKQKIDYSFDEIFLHNFDLPAPTALLKLSKVLCVGGYNENLKIEDWYMWLKLTECGDKLTYLNMALVNYRYHDSNISKNIKVMNDERKKVIDCFSHCENYYLADLKVQWLKATDYIYVDKILAFKQNYKIIRNNPTQLISINMLRFLFHLLRSFK